MDNMGKGPETQQVLINISRSLLLFSPVTSMVTLDYNQLACYPIALVHPLILF